MKIIGGMIKKLYLITGLFIFGLSISTTNAVNLQNFKQAEQSIITDKGQYIGDRIANILDNKFQNKYDRLKIALYLYDRIGPLKRQKPRLANILTQLQNYLLKVYIPEKLGFIPITVDYVIDGDTIKFHSLVDNKDYKLRMIGLDTPESNKTRYGYVECYGKQAKENLKKLVKCGNLFFVERDPTQGTIDKYGRMLGYLIEVIKQRCFQPMCAYRVININGEQIKQGYGWEYTYNKYHPYIYQDLFRQYQQYAETNNLGLWNPQTCNGERKKVEDITNETKTSLLDTLNTTTTTTNTSTSLSCKNIRNIYCSKLTSCRQAKYYLNTCGLKRLDKDGDGVPCESLCK